MTSFASNPLEILTFQNIFISKLSSAERKAMVKAALESDKLRKANYTASIDRQPGWLLMANVMIYGFYPPFRAEMDKNIDLKLFVLERKMIYDKEKQNKIEEVLLPYAEDYCK